MKRKVSIFLIVIMIINIIPNNLMMFSNESVVKAIAVYKKDEYYKSSEEVIENKLMENQGTDEKSAIINKENQNIVMIGKATVEKQFYLNCLDKEISENEIPIYFFVNAKIDLSVDEIKKLLLNRGINSINPDKIQNQNEIEFINELNMFYECREIGFFEQYIREAKNYFIKGISAKRIINAAYAAKKTDADISDFIKIGDYDEELNEIRLDQRVILESNDEIQNSNNNSETDNFKTEIPILVGNGINENIEIKSGALNRIVPSINLPGKNGLDLNLNLYYDSEDAFFTNFYYETLSKNYRRNQMGVGWSWNIDRGRYHFDWYDPVITLNLGSGASYKGRFNSDTRTFDLDNYPLKDLDLYQETNKYSDEGFWGFYLKDKNGLEKHFSGQGKLMLVKNKYGDQIEYFYKRDKESLEFGHYIIDKIIDSFGREIKFNYLTNTDRPYDGREVQVILPDGNKIRYILEKVDIANLEAAEYREKVYNLVEVIDQEGRITKIDYLEKDVNFSNSDKSKLTDSTRQILLQNVTYNTGASTVYTYEKATKYLGSKGALEYYRIESRGDNDKLCNQNNYIEYSYENNYTGYGECPYPWSLPSNFKYKTTISKNGINTTRTFNNNHLIEKEEVSDLHSKLKRSYHYEYDTRKQPKVTKTRIYSEKDNTKYEELLEKTSYDKYGNIVQSIDINNIRTDFQYDNKFNTLKKVVVNESDTKQKVVSNGIDTSNGNILRTETYVIKNGTKIPKNISTFEYYTGGLAKGNLKKEEMDLGNGKKVQNLYEYSDSYNGGLLTKEIVKHTRYDENKNEIYTEIIKTYDYNLSNGLMTNDKTLDNIGNILEHMAYDYDKMGRTIRIRNIKSGIHKSIEINDRDNIVTVTEENGFKHRTIYDSLGREHRKEKFEGGSWITLSSAKYNNAGQISETIDGNGNKVIFNYDPFGREISKRLEDGSTIETVYIDYNRTTTYFDPMRRKTEEKRDISGNVISTRVYDSKGNYNEVVNVYDNMNRLETTTDSKGLTTSYKYDDFGRLERIIAANGESTLYEYDKVDNLTKINTAGGSVITKEYDELGRLIKERNSLNQSEYISYNNLGQVVGKWDKAGNKTSFIYDNRGRIKQEKHEGKDKEEIIDYSYDDTPSNDYDRKRITKNGDSSIIEYFKNGAIKSKTEGGKTISYTYDTNGNTKSILDQSGTLTAYEGYNHRNQPKYVSVSGIPVTEYKYYADGKVQWKINDNGTKEEYIYNDIGHISFQHQYKGEEKTKSYEYHYDKNGNRIKEIESGKGITERTTIYEYDELNRVDNVVYPEGLKEKYTYDGNSNIENKYKYFNGILLSEERYVYDSTNKLLSKTESEYVSDLNIAEGKALSPESNSVMLTLSGNILVKDEQPGVYTKNTSSDEMLSKSIWSTESNDVELLSKEGKSITINIKDSIADKGTIVRDNYKSKDLEQMEIINSTTGSYIKLNIRELKAEDMLAVSTTLAPENVGPKIKVTHYNYDANGNLIDEIVNGASIKSYGYNNLNQLTDCQDNINNIIATYTYYPQGLRKSKTVSGLKNTEGNGTILFHYSGDNAIMEEKDNVLLSKYTIGLSYIRRLDSKNNKYYYLFDAHGDVTVVTDENGNIAKSYDYDIYGKAKSIVEDNNSVGQEFYNPIRYSGQFYDEESGFYYLRARYYSPEIMRFVSEDTYKGSLSNPLSLNYYLYCVGNPVMFFDPTGNQPEVAKKVMSFYKKSFPYKWFHKKTQDGELHLFFDLGGFDRDENGVYHAKQDGWQSWKYIGYNKFYDRVFDLATSMDKKNFDFSVGGEEFRLWLWKGDYINLGAGAEVGIYYGGESHWLTGVEYAMPMTLALYDNAGNQIFDWSPKEKNWWITGFNPDYQNVEASNLTVYGTIDFSLDQEHLDMWDSFYNKYSDNSMWEFDTENHKAKFKW